MIRALTAAAALAIVTLAAPAMAEILPSKYTLHKYQPTTTTQTFDCDFRQSGGNVQVRSKDLGFTFLAKDQGTEYIHINTADAITLTKTGQYSLQRVQGPSINC